MTGKFPKKQFLPFGTAKAATTIDSVDVLSVPNKAGGGPFLCYNRRIQPADSHHLTHFACGGVGKHEPSGGAGVCDKVEVCD